MIKEPAWLQIVGKILHGKSSVKSKLQKDDDIT